MRQDAFPPRDGETEQVPTVGEFKSGLDDSAFNWAVGELGVSRRKFLKSLGVSLFVAAASLSDISAILSGDSGSAQAKEPNDGEPPEAAAERGRLFTNLRERIRVVDATAGTQGLLFLKEVKGLIHQTDKLSEDQKEKLINQLEAKVDENVRKLLNTVFHDRLTPLRGRSLRNVAKIIEDFEFKDAVRKQSLRQVIDATAVDVFEWWVENMVSRNRELWTPLRAEIENFPFSTESAKKALLSRGESQGLKEN